jgi:hypothetical protein
MSSRRMFLNKHLCFYSSRAYNYILQSECTSRCFISCKPFILSLFKNGAKPIWINPQFASRRRRGKNWCRTKKKKCVFLVCEQTSGVRRQEREADHVPPTNAEDEKTWIYTSVPPYVFMSWCLVKSRDKFTFFFTFINQVCLKVTLNHMGKW